MMKSSSGLSSLISSWLPLSTFNGHHSDRWPLLQSSEEISLTVAATSQLSAPVVVTQSYSWVTPDSKPASPPAEYNPRLHRRQVTTVDVDVEGADGLGLMIRGGAEYGLGIYITGVDPGSSAQKAGLKVGDQILEVNGESFLAVTHDTAVSVLKHSRHLEMLIRRIAKVPHSCTTYQRNRSSKTRRLLSSEEHASENLDATLAMIEEKSKSVLVPYDHSRFFDTVTNYAGGRIPIARLLRIAEGLLNTPEKLSLLTELREVVRIADLNEFDATVFNKSSNLSLKKSQFQSVDMGSPGDIDSINRMVRSLQLSMDDDNVSETPSNIDSTLLEGSSKPQSKPVNNIGIKKKRKAVTRLKERKRNKTILESENRMVDQNIFSSNDLTNVGPNSKFKTNSKRKSLKKRLSEKSLISKDDITNDYQDVTPSHRHDPSREENVFLSRESTSQAQLLSSQIREDLSLPSLTSHSFQDGVTSQPSYYSTSFSATALHQPSFEGSYKSKDKLQQSPPSFSSPSKTTSPPPLFSPTFPESDGNSPIFSPCVPSSTHSSTIYSHSIPGKHRPPELFGGASPKVSLPYEVFDSRGRLQPSQISEDQESFVRGDFPEPFAYYRSRSTADFRNGRGDSITHPNYREQLDFREHVAIATSRIVDDPIFREERDIRNTAYLRRVARRDEATQMVYPSIARDGGYVNNKRRPQELNLVRDPRLYKEYTDPRGYSRDVFYPQPPISGSNTFDIFSRSSGDRRFGERFQMCQSCEIRNQGSHLSTSQPMLSCPHMRTERRSPLMTSDSQGRFHILVKKTKANLGIAIEGGADTKHPMPRVINIAANGAAYEDGGLRVGQIIMAVNGHQLEGKMHDEVAHIIANSWTDRSKSEMEFVVVDRKPHDSDLRRSSLLSQMS